MTIALPRDYPGIRPWLENRRLTGPPYAPYYEPENWPTWLPGGPVFTEAALRTPARHGAAIAWEHPAVHYGYLRTRREHYFYLVNDYDNGWTEPAAPSDVSASWLLECPAASGGPTLVDFEYTYDEFENPTSITATPSAGLTQALAAPQAVETHIHAGAPRPPRIRPTSQEFQFEADTVSGYLTAEETGLPLIYSGGGAPARQSTQAAFLTECFPTPWDQATAGAYYPFTWDGTDWTMSAPDDGYGSPLWDIPQCDGGWLYSTTHDPETGLITAFQSIPECRRCMFDFYPYAGGYPRFRAITWPGSARIRQFLGMRNTGYGCRIIWRPAPAWRFVSDSYAGGGGVVINSTNDAIPAPMGRRGWWRGVNFAAEYSDIDSAFLGTPSGDWQVLAETAVHSGTYPDPYQWGAFSYVTEPAIGQQVLVSGAEYYPPQFEGDPGGYYWGSWAEMWPEAAVLPHPVARIGGGLLAGG